MINWKEKNQKWRKSKNKTKTAKKKNRNYNLEEQTLYREKKISVSTEIENATFMIFGQNVIKNEIFKNNKRVTVSHFQTHPSILCFVMVEQGLCKLCFCFTSCSRLDFVTKVGGVRGRL